METVVKKTNNEGFEWKCLMSPNQQFYASRHRQYIEQLDNDKETLEYLMSDHLRMGGAFWGLGALDIMGFLPSGLKKRIIEPPRNNRNSEALEGMTKANDKCSTYDVSASNDTGCKNDITREKILKFVSDCYDSRCGGYGSNIGHDAHITSTLYAVLILAMFDALDTIPVEPLVKWVATLQKTDGSFLADKWGECDGRFIYCALCILTIVGRTEYIDTEAARNWILQCQNPDGAFGNVPGAESHAAYVFCCVGSLSLLESLDMIDRVRENIKNQLKMGFLFQDALGHWLSERQIAGRCGGFNGRPEKAPDVCYSWWILAALKMIGRDHWIDSEALTDFILCSQDAQDGGIADRMGDIADVFHTFFGVAGLSLLSAIKQLNSVDPVLSLTYDVIDRTRLAGAMTFPEE